MWIALGIIGFLAALITVILLLPLKVIIKNDEQEALILQCRFLFKTFGIKDDSTPYNPIVKALKTAFAVDHTKKENLQESVRSGDLKKRITETYAILKTILKEGWTELKHCKVTKLHIAICCTGDDADKAAIHYGACCAATYSFVNLLRNYFRVRERGCRVDITCDLFGQKPVFRYEVVLVVRVKQVLTGVLKVVFAEMKRRKSKQSDEMQ